MTDSTRQACSAFHFQMFHLKYIFPPQDGRQCKTPCFKTNQTMYAVYSNEHSSDLCQTGLPTQCQLDRATPGTCWPLRNLGQYPNGRSSPDRTGPACIISKLYFNYLNSIWLSGVPQSLPTTVLSVLCHCGESFCRKYASQHAGVHVVLSHVCS